MKYLLVITFLAVSLTVGCDAPGGTSSDPVVNVKDDDEAMTAAVAKATNNLPLFIKKWKQAPTAGDYSVKIGVKTIDDSLEHIWFEPIEFTDTEFTGICGNDPAKVPDLKLGDKRTFSRNDISDWMILNGQTCYGGYTIRVLSELQPDKAPPFEFKDL